MAKKVKAKITQETFVKKEGTAKLPDVAGYALRWVNHHVRNKHGWGIWSPVLKDSELGKKIGDDITDMLHKFKNPNENSNYITQGTDCILAFAPKDVAEASREKNNQLAEDRMNQIDAEKVRRNVMISEVDGYKK